MSVGGKVVEIIVCPDRVWVNTRERPEHRSTCAVYVERTPEALSISEGDTLWWQGRHAMWTPKSGAFHDRKLNRIGFSGISRASALGLLEPQDREGTGEGNREP